MRVRVWPARLLAFLILIGGAAAAPTAALKASLEPSAALLASGTISAAGADAVLELRPLFADAAPDQELLRAGRAVVVIDEYAWKSTAAADTGDAGPRRHTSSSHDVLSLIASVRDRSGSGHWFLRPGGDGTIRLQASCAVRPDVAAPVLLTISGTDLTSVAQDVRHGSLRADCEATSVLASDGITYWFDATRLTIAGLEQGIPLVLEAKTGTFTQPDPDLPGHYDHLLRVLRIAPHPTHPEEFAGTLSWSGRVEATIRAPALVASGRLDVPDSLGWLEWNGLHQTDVVPGFEATGAFVLRGRDSVRLDLDGLTQPPPAVAASSPRASWTSPDRLALLAAATSLGVLATLLAFAKRPVLVAAFTRLAESSLLDHRVRRRLMDAVTSDPGIPIRQLARTLGLPRGTLRHHVELLVARGLLVSAPRGRERLLFPPSRRDPADVAPVGRRGQAVLALIAKEPGVSQAQIARRLNASRTSISRWVHQLAEAGYVRAIGRTRRPRYVMGADAPREG